MGVIFHVDMDAFYASIHELHDPSLKGVPVVVGADPRGGKGRGVVSTCNYAARRFGIRSAMPISKAYEACPTARFIRPDFSLYKPASRDVMAILERYADVLQVVGMDEAYLDVTDATKGDFDAARNLARSLQAAIKRETGLSASIGVAQSKSIAKIASDHRKPHGITLVAPEDAQDFLDPLPAVLINGCGPKTAQRLEEWEIRTIGDLARSDRSFLEGRFGSHGAWLHDIANGHDPRQVHADRGPSKSRGNERTFGRDQADQARVVDKATDLCRGLLQSGDRRAFSTITVKLRYHDFTTLTRAHTLSIPLDPADAEAEALAVATAQGLLQPLLDGRPVRLVGVRLSGFSQATGQRSLPAFGVRTPSRRPVSRKTRPTAQTCFQTALA